MIDFGYAEDLRELRSLKWERRSNGDLRMRNCDEKSLCFSREF